MSAYRGPEPPDPAKERAEVRAFERKVGRGITIPRDASALVLAALFAGAAVPFAIVSSPFAIVLGVFAAALGAIGVWSMRIERRR